MQAHKYQAADFLGFKFAVVICNRTIVVINAKKTFVFAATLFPILKINLAQRKEYVSVIRFECMSGQDKTNVPLLILDQQ